ncbi:hypothetical protein [Paractinoplanes atraurantiacus]|uniref:Uncharacterized protein n=1 Tax=Paractinoplanes atraurantiacus TaxID=1036182 RepID=A0A285IYQ1_9ACTN|nr:hypothetical protein [Actinoplanes atraurantiacus]SNY52031.1 hypothetical protein SAMN05421748_112220 [Actinoplanes atraurantiacus]
MAARTMGRFTRTQTPHTDWCARDHRCGLNEHRSAAKVTARGTGRAVVTRVRAGDVEYAEVHIRIPLSRREDTARTQLATLLRLLGDLLDAVIARPHVLPARAGRRAIDRGAV